MVYYSIDKSLFKEDGVFVRRLVVISYIVVGLVIGACIGLWVAVKTVPLPDSTTNYIYKVN